MISHGLAYCFAVSRRLGPWVVGGALALAYMATAPVNRTDAEDAYEFAWLVERAPWCQLLHPHHLLALLFFRATHLAIRQVAPTVRSIHTMGLVSAIAAASAVVLLAKRLRQAGARDGRAELAAAALAMSFGFWRYAAEAELYALATALCLASWVRTAEEVEHARRTWLSSLLGAGAVLVHVFSVWAALAAIPLWLWQRAGPRRAVWYSAGVLALVVLAYVTAWQLPVHEVGGSDPLRSEGGLRPSAAIKAAVAAGSALVAGHFALGEPRVADWVQRRFPARMLEEELYLAATISPVRRAFAWTTLALLAAAAFGVIVQMARGMWRRTRAAESAIQLHAAGAVVQGLDENGKKFPKDWTALRWAAAVWWLGHAGLLLWMEPGNPELWVMWLPPLWILVATVPTAGVRPLWACVALLGVHNWVGGMSLLRDPAGDLHRAKAQAVLRVAREGDEIWTAGGPVFFRYLRYVSPADVVDLWAADPDLEAARPVWILGDVLQPPRALVERFSSRAAVLAELAARIRPRLDPVAFDGFGGVWRLRSTE